MKSVYWDLDRHYGLAMKRKMRILFGGFEEFNLYSLNSRHTMVLICLMKFVGQTRECAESVLMDALEGIGNTVYSS